MGTVVNELKGGLANQMFEIAAGYAYARDWGHDFAINYDIYADWHCGRPPHDYKHFYSKIPESDIRPAHTFTEKAFSHSPIEFVNPRVYAYSLKLKGYYQSPLYFDRYRDEVKDLFNFPEVDLTGIVDDHTIGIHIRRGDYVDYPEHDILSVDYFNRAIEAMGDGNIIICSDEPSWVQERFDLPLSPMKSDLEDLYLLSQCKRVILSNSSFSWWGAYLGIEKERVIVPEIWFGDPGPYDYHDIYMKEWEKMPI